jgi:hypothetical protein
MASPMTFFSGIFPDAYSQHLDLLILGTLGTQHFRH